MPKNIVSSHVLQPFPHKRYRNDMHTKTFFKFRKVCGEWPRTTATQCHDNRIQVHVAIIVKQKQSERI